MKKQLLLFCSTLFAIHSFSQEHFSGINTSKRIGLLNASVNPSELVNMKRTYDINVFNMSINLSNNKVGFNDLIEGENLEDKIFSGSEPTSVRLDFLLQGPSFAMKYKKWAFGISSAGNIKANAIDVDVNFGNAVTNNFLGTAQINSSYNQRMNAISWGEIGLSAARTIFENEKHKFNAGVTFKLLFPGAYMNLGVDKLTGNVTYLSESNIYLTNAQANVNISYSGKLANDFSEVSNYTDLFAGGLNGFGTDFGVNYQLKDSKNPNEYKLNAGLSLRNFGSLTFKEDNNNSTNYSLDIQGLEAFNLSDFENSESIQDIEQTLINSGYVTKQDSKKDFKVKLPAVINLYADYNIYKKWSLSAYLQQKLKDDSENDIATIQNVFTITPRFGGSHYEIYLPLSNNEISGFTTGIGFRLGGFFIGSGSIVTAVLNNSNQTDFYTGFRFNLK